MIIFFLNAFRCEIKEFKTYFMTKNKTRMNLSQEETILK